MKPIRIQSSLSRDFMLFASLMFVLLIIASVWVAYGTYESHAERVLNKLENEAIRIDRELIVEIKNSSYLLESLGRQVSQIDTADLAHVSRLLRSFDDGDKDQNIFGWIDNSQALTISSHRGLLTKPIPVDDRDFTKKSLIQTWQPQIGRPVISRVSEKWVLPVSMGITNIGGKYLGSLVVYMSIDRLMNNIKDKIQDSGISYAILSKTLVPLATMASADHDGLDTNILPFESLTEIDFDKKPSGVLSKSNLFKQDEKHALYETSSKFPYIILIAYDAQTSSKQLFTLLLPRLVEMAILCLLLLFVLWIVKVRIIRPVELLSVETQRLIRGQRAFTGTVENAPKEIEQLAAHIKKLGRYVSERQRTADELLVKNTYLRRIKENAQLMNKVRTQFLVAMSDELNKPIDFIREHAETIKDQHFGPIRNEAYIQQASDIHKSSRQLGQMILDIQSIAELEQGVFIVYEKSVNVSFVIHKSLRTFLEQPQHRHIDVKLRQDDNLPPLFIDENRLHQILLNLLTGAAYQIADGSSMLLESSVEINDSNEQEYVFMLKYNMRSADSEDIEPNAKFFNLLDIHEKEAPLLIRSEGINLALTRMLVSLYQGVMEVKTSSNRICRIYIRFPESRVKMAGDTTPLPEADIEEAPKAANDDEQR